MGYVAIFEIFLNFIQYLGIISSVHIQWPFDWQPIIAYLKYLRFDFTFQLPNIDVPPLDFRSQHLLLTNILPLILSLLLLIFFKSFFVVLWYASLLASICLFLAGMVVQFLPSAQFHFESDLAEVMMITGGVLICFLILVLVVSYYRQYQRKKRVFPTAASEAKKETNDKEEEDEEEKEIRKVKDEEKVSSLPDLEKLKIGNQYKRKSIAKQIRNFFVSSILILLGLTSSQLIPTDWMPFEWDLGYVGLTFLILGLVLFYNFFSNLFYKGREWNTELNNFFKANFLQIILLFLSILYIPITTSIFSSSNCQSVTCTVGQEFPLNTLSLSIDSFEKSYFRKSTNQTCLNCDFIDQCPIASQLCPGQQDLRLVADPSISCTTEIYPFYLPGSLLVLFVFSFGTPYLFYKIISIAQKYIEQIPAKGLKNEQWQVQVFLSKNSCRSLYAEFSYQWRYYRLIIILQKLVIVAIFIFSTSQPNLLVVALCFFHTLFAGISLYSRPYQSHLENLLSILCLLINSLNASVGFVLNLGFTVPSLMAYILAFLNSAFPVLFVLGAAASEWKMAKERKKKAVLATLDEEKYKKDLAVKKRQFQILKTQKMKKDSDSDSDSESESDEDEKEEKLVEALDIKSASKQSLDRDLKQLVENLDKEMNAKLLGLIVNFFLLFGVVCFLSICVSLIGILVKIGSNDLISWNLPADQIQKGQFAGYQDWSTFTQNCCCMNRTSSDQLIMETWKCLPPKGYSDFLYKEMLRGNSMNNGLDLRSFCAKNFTSLVCQEPQFNHTLNAYAVTLCNGTQVDQYW